jgi:hypothetical protein
MTLDISSRDLDAADRPARRRQRWQAVAAWYDGGEWLAADQDDGGLVAFAPPGVGFTGAPDEPAERWQFGAWSPEMAELAPCPPDDCRPCTVSEVLDAVPGALREWVLEATEEQIEVLSWYASTLDATTSINAARAAQTADALRQEIEAAGDRDARLVALPAADGDVLDRFQRGCDALTDVDFSRFVSGLLGASWKIDMRLAQSRLGADIFVGDGNGGHHVVYVDHDPRPGRAELVHAFSCYAQQLKERATCWLVSVKRHQQRSWHECEAQQRVLGPRTLAGMLRAHPQVADTHLKFRLAAESLTSCGVVDGATRGALAGLAETSFLARGRQELRERGALVLSGAPGMGKTTLMRVLAAEASLEGFRVVDGDSSDASEHEEPIVVVADDVDDPYRLSALLQLVASRRDALMIATTPDFGLATASGHGLHMAQYPRADRAEIVYSSLWPRLAAGPDWIASRWAGTFERLIECQTFTPRMAAECVSDLPDPEGPWSETPDRPVCETVPGGTPSHADGLLERLRAGWATAAQA